MHKQINQLGADLMAQFPERKDVIDGSLAAVLAGKHVLLIGPPGTAKSALVRCLAQVFGGSYFERLLTKFSTPEELFGPISLKTLEQDRFARVTTGKLPEAEFAFIDEISKSNSAVLNSLLAVINERVFHNDGALTTCPLIALFGASNELPEGKELEALFDRFLLRFDVGYLLVASNLRAVLVGPDPAITAKLTMDDLRRAQAEVASVKLTDDTVDALLSIRDACRGEGIIASDRRWKKALKLVKSSAWLAAEKKTCPEDLAILVDSLWREPKERSKIAHIDETDHLRRAAVVVVPAPSGARATSRSMVSLGSARAGRRAVRTALRRRGRTSSRAPALCPVCRLGTAYPRHDRAVAGVRAARSGVPRQSRRVGDGSRGAGERAEAGRCR